MPLTAHFLNVGQGDCTIIEFPSGRVAMVDVHNLKVLDAETKAEVLQEYHESMDYLRAVVAGRDIRSLEDAYVKAQEAQLTDPLAYYDAHIGSNRDIFRLIITHPDMDHMTGLYRLHCQDSRKAILNFWHSGEHDFNLADCSDDDWQNGPYNKLDWETYKALRRSGTAPKALQKFQGNTGSLWTDDGIEIWAPTEDTEAAAVEKSESNIISYVIRISHAGRSIVLGGDATAKETWPAIYPHLDMTGCDVLKASHHGRKTGYYRDAVKEMSPWLTITSVGEKAHDATDSYRRYSDYSVSLRKTGDIQITIGDDGTLTYPAAIEEHWKPKKT